MGRLALVAILLLAMVPTLGRIAQARAAGADAAPAWAAMCTMQGLRQVPLPSPPAPQASGDCAYCPLLAATLVATVGAPSVPSAALPRALCTSIASDRKAELHACGLGSRGPPSAS